MNTIKYALNEESTPTYACITYYKEVISFYYTKYSVFAKLLYHFGIIYP